MGTIPGDNNATADGSRDEEYSMPCMEALLAGTLALMTGYAQACCDSHREAMARKIATNLESLAQAQALSPHFRTMLWNLLARWQPQGLQESATAALTAAEQRRALWMKAPEALQ